MEDAAVEFLLENLKQLQLHKAHLIFDVKNQIQLLESNLSLFKRFLNDSTENRNKDETLEEVVGQIIRVVYEAEDAVEAFMSQAVDKGLEKYFKRAFDSPTMLLSTAVQEVELTGTKVREIHDQKKVNFGEPDTGTGQKNQQEEIKVPHVKEDFVVGFEDEAKKLICYLTEETNQQLDVISIVGMAGLGKTTLAQKIFHDARIKSKFPIRLWVDVSSDFRKKDVYLTMLRDLSWMTEDMYDKTEAEIAQTLRACLDKDKFLIILDDMWNTQVWDDLQDIFTKSNNRTSKILITSRMKKVAKYANPNREPHMLPFRAQDESWELLQLVVFGKHECPRHLISVGRHIAKQCDGVPLIIKLIGGILAKKASVSEMHNRWNKVAEALQADLYHEIRLENVVSFCYKMLPYYLRPCFLYLGMFPEDFDIPVQRLILLWIAEGFIQQKTPGKSLEETGEEYLEDLIDRNLVMTKVSRTGRIKTCRVHDLIRDFCTSEAQKYFFHEIQGSMISSSDFDDDQYLHKYRHISIHSLVVNFLSSQPYGPRARTLLHFLREETILLPENVASIPDAFKLLRVLDVKPIRFTRFPFYLTQLVHLRYICLSSDFKVLPEAISKMWNIQTLIVDTTSRVLEIKADIWKMLHLRHLETNASIILRKSIMIEGDHNNQGENIQTLANISPESCAQVFERASNLKKLGIRGQLTMLITKEDNNSNGGSSSSTPFDGLRKLGHLERLKLLNDVGASPLSGLPPSYKFPPKLMSLTLSYTFLDWKYMSILGMLESLKVLKLRNNAFMGECWETVDNGFPQLEVLQVEYTNLVAWKASSNTHFPKLQYIALRNCEQLKALPFNLADVATLLEIHLYRTTKYAAASAKKIQELSESRKIEISVFPLEYE